MYNRALPELPGLNAEGELSSSGQLASLYVDFDILRKDLVADALSKLTPDHLKHCVLRQFVAAFVEEVNELYDAVIDVEKYRSLYYAANEQLDAIGRIVGSDRTFGQEDESMYFFSDRPNQGCNKALVWCINGSMTTTGYLTDSQYRNNIIQQIIKNMTLCASVPEITNLINLATGDNASFKKTGPMTVDLYIPSSIYSQNFKRLITFIKTLRCDDVSPTPYPVTLSLSGYVVWVPGNYFKADTMDGFQCDAGRCAVSTFQPILTE